MDELILQNISQVLRALTPEKPWMTAAGLSRKIKTGIGGEYTPARIENTLTEHCQSPKRAIRYSYYPSKKTLDILWGHVEVIGEKQDLAELDREDEPEYEPCENIPENAPWFFVSHNHRDFGDALELRRLISEKRYGAWLFETEIPRGGMITPLAGKGIRECKFFLAYVTRRSIGSLWVQKEWEVARSQDCETYVVVDGMDKDLLRLFEDWTNKWPRVREGTLEFCSAAAHQLDQSSDSIWARRCEAFVDSLHEYVGDTNLLLTYPTVRESTPWRGKLKIQPFELFLAAVVGSR